MLTRYEICTAVTSQIALTLPAHELIHELAPGRHRMLHPGLCFAQRHHVALINRKSSQISKTNPFQLDTDQVADASDLSVVTLILPSSKGRWWRHATRASYDEDYSHLACGCDRDSPDIGTIGRLRRRVSATSARGQARIPRAGVQPMRGVFQEEESRR